MAKSTVETITNDVKSLVDYNITDSDLDALILRSINLAIKRMKGWFMDEGMFDEIGATISLSTVADQEYIDIATDVIDLDQPLSLTERTNDSVIQFVPFKDYREMYPDPSSDSSATPDVFSIFANRLYLGPTPSGVITLYLDYFRTLTKLGSTDSMPYEDEYDEVIIAIAISYMVKWLDRGNRAAIITANEDVDKAKHDYIVGRSRNVGMNQQVQSRRTEVPYFSPRKVIT